MNGPIPEIPELTYGHFHTVFALLHRLSTGTTTPQDAATARGVLAELKYAADMTRERMEKSTIRPDLRPKSP